MTIDNYAPCPCGSGKKIKYCKCVDQPQDYEKIVRLIEGGQELAALDRVNQYLAKTPNAAWLLAIKAELALSMREIDTFKDTAKRFLKLKPDNPLALIMRSFVALLDMEPLENAARLLLEGLAESREGLPRLALTSIQLLADRLLATGKAALRFFWARLLNEFQATANEEQAPLPKMLTDNLLSMSPVYVLPTPPGAPWTERTNEVAALISAFRYAQAETKLRSILRDYPDQPGPLTQLLQVQLVLLDQEGATATASKLSNVRDMPESQRDYYAALALDIEKDQVGVHPQALSRYCEISSDEAAREALNKLECVELLPDELAQEMKSGIARSVGDEVPAKTAYNVFVSKTFSSGKTYLAGCGTVALFGRQTDKPARALIVIFNMPDTQAVFEQLIAAINPIADLKDPTESRSYSYVETLGRSRVHKTPEGERVGLTMAEQSEALADDFLNLPIPALGNLTPLQAVEEEPRRARVRAVLTHLEGSHHVVTEFGTIDKIYERLQFTRPVNDLNDANGEFKVQSFLELTRVDIPTLNDELLGRLFISALTLEIESLSYQAAKEVLKRPSSPEMDAMRTSALNTLSQHADSADEALDLLEQLEEALAKQDQTVGMVIMRRFSVLNSLGREQEAHDLMRDAFEKYPDDPYLVSVLQYMTQQAQRGNVDATVDDRQLLSRMARRAEPEPESGLVLPGQAPGAESGKSKLWLPGS